MTLRKARILLGLAAGLTLGGAAITVAPVAPVVHAESCAHGHGQAGAWDWCTGLPPGYAHRVRAHYLTGIGTGGYVYGQWRPNGVSSTVGHVNIDSEVVALCAGAGCF